MRMGTTGMGTAHVGTESVALENIRKMQVQAAWRTTVTHLNNRLHAFRQTLSASTLFLPPHISSPLLQAPGPGTPLECSPRARMSL